MVEAATPGGGSSSAFQWNAGGWFGAQLGSTLWLAILGAVFLAQGRASGWAPLLAFAAANAAGLGLWRRRHALAAYPALQILVAACFLATLAALLGLEAAGDLAAVDPRFASRPRALYGVLLVFPALMLLFLVRERSARRGKRA